MNTRLRTRAAATTWLVIVGVALTAFACATESTPAVVSPAAATSASSTTTRLAARLPPGFSSGTTFVVVYSKEEVASGMPTDVKHFFEVLRRVSVVIDQDARADSVAFDVDIPTRPADVYVFHDAAKHGLEALFGSRPGLATGVISVDTQGTPAPIELTGVPFTPPSEACVGERLELLVIDAPETRRAGDDGKRSVCVQVPPSYGSSQRRYPLLLVFPGFSGWHARNDGWGARSIFERVGTEFHEEVIVVGIGTRTPEGTSYLDTSKRFGDWDAYVAERLIPDLDRRYRTDGRRAAVGHSTGGWNAIHLALSHPDLVSVVAASSPDALDLDLWLLDDDGQVRDDWKAWLRAEAAIGGRGQFVSYAASWSADDDETRGFAWPISLDDGALRPDVYAKWRARSPIVRLQTDDGLKRAQMLHGRVALTAGRHDEFSLFAPTESYARALEAKGVDVEWLPTELGHFGEDEARFAPLARFVFERWRSIAPTVLPAPAR